MSIEEEFFKVFGIKPRDYYSCNIDSYCPFNSNHCDENCPYWEKYKTAYLEITDRILLELICILAKNMEIYSIKDTNIKDLKNNILHRAINLKEIIKHQVRSLFEGVEE